MTAPIRPMIKPQIPNFSSGPSAKRPGWNIHALANAVVARSHRSADAIDRNRELIALSRRILKIPDDYAILITPGSDTGAMELAIWSLLGPRAVDVLVFDHFGEMWRQDIIQELKIKNARVFASEPGQVPDLSQIDSDHDVVFCWNGSTTGVRIPHTDWIDPARAGLTICDATSAVFAYDLPWDLLDVTTYSWQKVLGGEAAHGMMILSPRAIERLESYDPPWPMLRLFRLKKNGKMIPDYLQGQTINTPSLLCIEDCIDALRWVESHGGLDSMIARSKSNLSVVEQWVQKTPWAEFMAQDSAIRSRTAICLKIQKTGLSKEENLKLCQAIAALIAQEKAGFDIMGHREAPPNLRIWGGGMVESSDIQKLLPWIEWAYSVICGAN